MQILCNVGLPKLKLEWLPFVWRRSAVLPCAWQTFIFRPCHWSDGLQEKWVCVASYSRHEASSRTCGRPCGIVDWHWAPTNSWFKWVHAVLCNKYCHIIFWVLFQLFIILWGRFFASADYIWYWHFIHQCIEITLISNITDLWLSVI
jgi:hypothetical protein